MNSFKTAFLFALIFTICFISCKKPSPQLPSNKIIESDESAKTMLDINSNLALKEDSLLQKIAVEQHQPFIKSELGFWYRIDTKTNGKQLKINDVCKASYKLMFTNRKIVFEKNIELTVGKKQVVTGLEEGIKLMKKGERATFIVPWYLAYGMTGFENQIPPYTSLIYEVKLAE